MPDNVLKFISGHNHIRLDDYAKQIYQRKLTNINIHQNLIKSFNLEFKNRQFNFKLLSADDNQLINKKNLTSLASATSLIDEKILTLAVSSLFKNMCLQTAHHQCLTNGPGFSAIDYVATKHLTENENYLVATFSSLPFSNNAFSGALCFNNIELSQIFNPAHSEFGKIAKSLNTSLAQGASEKRVFLIPNHLKEQMIFGTKIADKTKYMFDALNKDLQARLPSVHAYQDFSNWALDFCQTIQQTTLSKQKIFYFDINRIIQEYLIFELHADYKKNLLLSSIIDSKLPDIITKKYGHTVLFLKSNLKNNKITRITWQMAREQWANNKDKLIEELTNQNLCPGLFLVFSILMFENNIRCFGSFLQFNYIDNFFEIYKQLFEISHQQNLSLKNTDDVNVFCAARFPKSQNFSHALDLFVTEKKFKNNVPHNPKMEYFWQEFL